MAGKESDMRSFIATCITLSVRMLGDRWRARSLTCVVHCRLHCPVYSLIGSTASASTFTFSCSDTDPFAGTTVLTTPGRQIVGGADFIAFSPATDIFALDATVFGVGNSVLFVNDFAGNVPASGLTFIVLETFDDDNNPLTPFGAGNSPPT